MADIQDLTSKKPTERESVHHFCALDIGKVDGYRLHNNDSKDHGF